MHKLFIYATATLQILLGMSLYLFPPSALANNTISRAALDDSMKENDRITKADKQLAKTGRKKNLVEALDEPGMDSTSIPLHPELFHSFEKRPESESEKQFRQRLINSLWNTPLGQMFYYYLFADISRIQLPSLSRQMVRRIFSESSHVSVRISAIYLLIEDVYVRDKMSLDTTQRMAILQGDIFQQNESGNASTKNRAVIIASVFFLFALPFGFPLVRKEARNAVSYYTKVIFRRTNKASKPSLQRLFNSKVFKGYEPFSAANFFFSTFGPFSLCYFFYIEWLSAALGKNVGDISLLSGLEEIMKVIRL